jgi:hypothetical protein
MKFRRGVDAAPEADTELRVEEIGTDRGTVFGSVVARGYLPERPNNSYRNLLRTGFEERYVRANYLSPAE